MALFRFRLAGALVAAALVASGPAGAAPKKKKKAPTSEKTPMEAEPEYGPTWPPPPPPAPVETEEQLELRRHPPFRMTRGQVLVGAKFGGAFAQPFSGLGASFVVGVEAGWVLPKLPAVGSGFAVTLDFLYTQPGASGDQTDPRIAVNGGSYHYDVTQRELSLGLTVLYRLSSIRGGRFVPYIGFGPRLFFLQTVTGGQAGGGNDIAAYHEQSTRIGFGAPLGADFLLGPGRIFLEAMLLYAPFNHNVTGESNAGAITIQAGYRFLL